MPADGKWILGISAFVKAASCFPYTSPATNKNKKQQVEIVFFSRLTADSSDRSWLSGCGHARPSYRAR
jgi:hypothetical protein